VVRFAANKIYTAYRPRRVLTIEASHSAYFSRPDELTEKILIAGGDNAAGPRSVPRDGDDPRRLGPCEADPRQLLCGERRRSSVHRGRTEEVEYWCRVGSDDGL
jgi:hypothetical protein